LSKIHSYRLLFRVKKYWIVKP